MDLCNDEHEEVCYEGRKCPACAMREELQGQIDDLNRELSKANARADELEAQS